MDMKTKICTKCKEDKSLEDYYRKTANKNNRQSECKGCHNARQKEYRKTDKGKLTNIKYRKSDKNKLVQAKYVKSDKGKLSGTRRQTRYYKTDKGKAKIARGHHNRNTKVKNTLCTLTDKEFNFIVFDCQNNKCIGPDHEGSRYFIDKLKPTRDHIIPVELGGDFIKENIQALCVECNSRKGIKIIDFRTKKHKRMIKAL